MRKTGLKTIILTLFLLAGSSIAAETVSVSFGSWLFLRDTSYIENGAYGSIGANIEIHPWLELSTFTLAQFTPNPGSELYQGIGIASTLLAPRSVPLPDGPSYINSIFEFGLLFGFHDLYASTGEPFSSTIDLYARVTPLVLGNSFYGSRERIASLGVLYGLTERSISIVWNFAIYDRFLVW